MRQNHFSTIIWGPWSHVTWKNKKRQESNRDLGEWIGRKTERSSDGQTGNRRFQIGIWENSHFFSVLSAKMHQKRAKINSNECLHAQNLWKTNKSVFWQNPLISGFKLRFGNVWLEATVHDPNQAHSKKISFTNARRKADRGAEANPGDFYEQNWVGMCVSYVMIKSIVLLSMLISSFTCLNIIWIELRIQPRLCLDLEQMWLDVDIESRSAALLTKLPWEYGSAWRLCKWIILISIRAYSRWNKKLFGAWKHENCFLFLL